MKFKTTRQLTLLLASSLLSMAAIPADQQVAQAPLFFSDATTPNVMFLLDNSGESAATGSGGIGANYDASITYPAWGAGFRSGNIQVGAWNGQPEPRADTLYYCPSEGAIPKKNGLIDGAGNPDFNAVFIYGNNDSEERCIGVVADDQGSTTYDANFLNYLFETYGVDGQSINQPRATQLASAGGDGDTGEPALAGTARSLIRTTIQDFPNIRFGLTVLNGNDGGTVLADCSDDANVALTALDSVAFNNEGRPMAEALYEITRYYRGLDSAYTPGTSFTSPIQFRCQPSFVVALVGGHPTFDSSIPPTGSSDSLSNALPNFDQINPATSQSDFPDALPDNSDGFGPGIGSESEPGYSLYFDDMAAFANQDLIVGGTDQSGGDFDDSFNPDQTVVTYVIGLGHDSQGYREAAAAGGGEYFSADNANELKDKLEASAFSIRDRTGSGSSVAANTTRVETGALIFQARFTSTNWSGELVARPVESNGDLGEPTWTASEQVPEYTVRKIFTMKEDGSKIPFQYADLSATQQAYFNTDLDGVEDSQGAARVEMLRGRALTGLERESFRVRAPIGDIINSDPEYVGKQNFGYAFLAGVVQDDGTFLYPEADTYPAFIASKENRSDAVYVGANDGMLHSFDADTGVELFAYMPRSVLPNVKKILDSDYVPNHKYFVDGSQRAVDAYYGGAWHTVLVGSMGAGGTSIYALDVTVPEQFTANNILWEVDSSTHTQLGVSIPTSTIGKLNNGDWAAIVANGYNSADGTAQLLVFNLTTGALITAINTFVGSTTDKNGLSSPIPVDVDGDQDVDYIYAGDLYGNMWKFDLSSTSIADWGIANQTSSGGNVVDSPLFTACDGDACSAANRQSITARPEVAKKPGGGYVVFFGTGRYFVTGDNLVDQSDTRRDAFYGIFDSGAANGVISSRSVLREQTLIGEPIYVSAIDSLVRVTTDFDATSSGWYFKLPDAGERHVARPILRNERIIFSTLIPSTEACVAGGTSFLMELDALNGARLADSGQSTFDIDGDGDIDANDKIEVITDNDTQITVSVSGLQSTVGIVKTPGVISAGDKEFKYLSGTSGSVQKVTESNGGGSKSRLSWRQIK